MDIYFLFLESRRDCLRLVCWATGHIYWCIQTREGLSKIIIKLFLHLQPSLRRRGITSPEKTDRGYELRSRGPATLGSDVLDILCQAIPSYGPNLTICSL